MSARTTEERDAPEESVSRARWALGAFAAYLAVSWWVLIFRLGSGRWFFRDDWEFLAGRDAGSLHDVFRPHDVHPAAIPVVVFRLMFNVFGLRFTPYLVVIVTMHLGLVILLRVIMRRAGVGPWVATAAAGTLVLFGPGEENIHWAFQINFVGALLLGLVQLVLADHDGRYGRRDVVGTMAGVAAVMCSGLGPFMVVSVGLATLARRGWRMALLHTVPAAVAYVTWVLLANPAEYDFARPGPSVAWAWIREGQVGTLEALGQLQVAAALLALLLVGGLVLLLSTTSLSELRHRVAIPGSLLLCGPLFFVLTAQGRWVFGLELARSSRYLYVGAVCLLPALAVAGDAVVRRWRGATVGVVALLLVGVPGNIGAFGTSIFNDRYFEVRRQTVLAVPRTAEAEQVPRWVRPLADPYNSEDLTIGWLLDVRDAGRLPAVHELDPRVTARFPIALGLAQVAEPSPGLECETRSTPIDLSPRRGDRLGIRLPVNVALVVDGEKTSPWVPFSPDGGETLSVELPSLELRFAPTTPGASFTLCR
ncbi:MAG: hypothetical protein ABIX10_00135 [Acidimicrobiales bacterium]